MIKLSNKNLIKTLIFCLIFLSGFKNIDSNEFSIKIVNIKNIKKICVLFEGGEIQKYSLTKTNEVINIKNEKKPLEVIVFFRNKFVKGKIIYDESNSYPLKEVIVKKISSKECIINYMFKTDLKSYSSAEFAKIEKVDIQTKSGH